ncbi:MAG: hypothetical protein EBR93_04680, partial [Bacteroidetes bacterium]|nr:hypothetical protein [Bacteroidota bacterium]
NLRKLSSDNLRTDQCYIRPPNYISKLLNAAITVQDPLHMESPLNSKYMTPLPPACGPDRRHAIAMDGDGVGGIPSAECCLWVIHKDTPEMMSRDLLNIAEVSWMIWIVLMF